VQAKRQGAEGPVLGRVKEWDARTGACNLSAVCSVYRAISTVIMGSAKHTLWRPASSGQGAEALVRRFGLRWVLISAGLGRTPEEDWAPGLKWGAATQIPSSLTGGWLGRCDEFVSHLQHHRDSQE
jgi:hypothetical protein